MHIQSYIPGTELSHLIKTIMVISAEMDLDDRFIPHACKVLSFRLNTQSWIHSDGKMQLPSSHSNKGTVLVVFRNGGLAAFDTMPFYEMTSSFGHAGEVFSPGSVAQLEEELPKLDSAREQVFMVESFLQCYLIKPYQNKARKENAKLVMLGNRKHKETGTAANTDIDVLD